MTEDYDNTKLSAWQNCEQQGDYAHGYEGTGIIPKEPSVALAFGLGFHAMADAWCNQWLRGENDIEKQHAAFIQEWERELPVELRESLELKLDKHSVTNAKRLFQAYCDKFPPTLYKPVEVERPFRFLLGELPSGDEIYWTGILDRIVEFQGETYFLELKTSSRRIDENWLRQFQVSSQLRGYIWAGQQIIGKEFAGAIIHGVEKGAIPKTDRGKRSISEMLGASIVEVSPQLIEKWRVNTLHKIEAIQAAEAAGSYIQNLGDACNAYNFSGCPYRQLCGNPKEIRERLIESEYVKRVWNPLAADGQRSKRIDR